MKPSRLWPIGCGKSGVMTATARYAHVILPTVAFGEEQVTFTSTDRRIQLGEKVTEPPPGPLPAWQQLTMTARALGASWP